MLQAVPSTARVPRAHGTAALTATYPKSRPQQPNPSMGSVSAEMGPPACAEGEKCVVYNDGSDPDAVAADAARADLTRVHHKQRRGKRPCQS